MGEEYPIGFDSLQTDFNKKKPIVLFLGAGINSNEKDNLMWDTLLDYLLPYAFDLIPQLQYNTEDTRSIINDRLFPRDVKSTIVKQILGDTFYGKLIRDFLYKKISRSLFENIGEVFVNYKKNKSKDTPKSFYSLFVIADMIIRCPNIKAVVTYNYDQFLEDAIKYLLKNHHGQRKYHLISGNGVFDEYKHDFDFNDVNIYHVHGFIPRYDEIQSPQNTKIILSLDEYYEDTKNVYSWQVASQLHFLSQYTCWFCGLSMDDITTQRLLHYVKETHRERLYYITAGDKTNTIKCTSEKIKNKYHENNGLTVIYDKEGFNHIYNLLEKL